MSGYGQERALARRRQEREQLELDRAPTPDPGEACPDCHGQGGWWWIQLGGDEWEVCIYCSNGPDDPETPPATAIEAT